MGMKKKNIEKVFQEKLRDYSQLPEEHVWDHIAASLDKKRKKRRIIPIWWKLGGVAAALVIAFFLFRSPQDLPNGQEIITKVTKSMQTSRKTKSSLQHTPILESSGREIEKYKTRTPLMEASEEKSPQSGTANREYANQSLE